MNEAILASWQWKYDDREIIRMKMTIKWVSDLNKMTVMMMKCGQKLNMNKQKHQKFRFRVIIIFVVMKLNMDIRVYVKEMKKKGVA